jgi:diguanylate cyclase (GGDEF)-like protein
LILKKILLVDDSRTVLSLVSLHIETEFPHIEIITADSLTSTKEVLKKEQDFFLALLDLNLPDAQNGEVVKYVLGFDIPVIVFSATFNKETRHKLLSYNILDYVVKSSHNFDYLSDLIRFKLNYLNSSIVVFDSLKSRKRKTTLALRRLGMNIIDIEESADLLDVLDTNDTIKVLLISKEIDGIDSISLLQKIRQKHTKDKLVVIALTPAEDLSSIEFLKNGANSFLKIPFYEEELISLILTNLQTISFIQKIEDNANKDPLTGLFNRRYLFKQAQNYFLNSTSYDLSVAMVDIDFFKKINDNYGHPVGDKVIQIVSDILAENIANDGILARYGGEEFCVMFFNKDFEQTNEILEKARLELEQKSIHLEDEQYIQVTISIGFTKTKDSFDNMLHIADEALYEAKQSGRNKVISK